MPGQSAVRSGTSPAARVDVVLAGAEERDEVVPAVDDRLAVLEAEQEGVLGQGWDEVAALDAGRARPR
ncbi:hypothetical protein [Streptomyces sp. NPDC048385]|uniref:hypothetical protein n=1 Tax=unclassified Streptomyces TaxID=2593676 RepID=UPI00343D3E88